MALAFSSTKGKAQSNKVEAYEYKDGENVLRLFGGVLPRYVYWVKGTNNKDIPIECLAFDRTLEKFNNLEVDHVPAFFPDKKCSWSYTINCLDPKDGKAKALNLKKKLFEQILSAAEDLGADPTDPDTGFDIVFKRVKNGPLPFNVEYNLAPLKLKVRALTEEERAEIAKAKSIDEKYPRPTAEEIHALLVKITSGSDESEDEAGGAGTDQEAARDV